LLTFLEAVQSRLKAPTWSHSGEVPLPVHTRHLAVYSHGRRGSVGSLFIRALIVFVRAPPSLPNHFPEIAPTNTITFGGWDCNTNFGGHKYSDNNSKSKGHPCLYYGHCYTE